MILKVMRLKLPKNKAVVKVPKKTEPIKYEKISLEDILKEDDF